MPALLIAHVEAVGTVLNGEKHKTSTEISHIRKYGREQNAESGGEDLLSCQGTDTLGAKRPGNP